MKTLVTILFFVISICAAAQTLTLQQCIDTALAHSPQITAEDLSIEQAQLGLKVQKHTFLPTVQASINNGISAGFQQTFSETLSGEYSSVKAYSNSAALNVGVELWNAGARRTLVKHRELLLNVAMQSRQIRLLTIKTDVIANFFSLAMAQKRLEIADENCVMQDSNLIIIQKLYDLGHRSLRDVLDARTNLSQDKMQRQSEFNNLAMCELQLRTALNTLDSVSISVDSIVYQQDIPTFDTFYQQALAINPEISALNTQIEAAKIELKYYKKLRYPSLSINYEAGTQGQKFMNQQNKDFAAQWRDNSYQSLYLQLNVPIFSKLSGKDNIAQSKIAIMQRQNDLEQKLQTLNGELHNVWLGVVQSHKNAELAIATAQLAQQQYNFALKDFRIGNIASYELYVYKNKLVSSQLQAVSLQYEFFYRLAILKLFVEQ